MYNFENLINRMKNSMQDYYWHPEGNVYIHTELVFNCLKKHNDKDLLLAAIFHDMGKPETQTIRARDKDFNGDISKLSLKDLKISNIGHEYKCEKYIDKYFYLFSDISTNIKKVKEICNYHLKAHLYISGKLKKEKKRKDFENLKYFDELIKFEYCDANSNKKYR